MGCYRSSTAYYENTHTTSRFSFSNTMMGSISIQVIIWLLIFGDSRLTYYYNVWFDGKSAYYKLNMIQFLTTNALRIKMYYVEIMFITNCIIIIFAILHFKCIVIHIALVIGGKKRFHWLFRY